MNGINLSKFEFEYFIQVYFTCDKLCIVKIGRRPEIVVVQFPFNDCLVINCDSLPRHSNDTILYLRTQGGEFI